MQPTRCTRLLEKHNFMNDIHGLFRFPSRRTNL
jgi:hypothetical protein